MSEALVMVHDPEKVTPAEVLAALSADSVSEADALDGFAHWCEEKGLELDIPRHPAALESYDLQRLFLGIKDAAKTLEIGERTLRRYISDGVISTTLVRGRTRNEHRLFLPSLYTVLVDRRHHFERVQSSPVEDLAREMKALREELAASEKARADREAELLRKVKDQAEEMHGLRGQLASMHEQIIRALPAPAPPKKPTLWERVTGKNKDS